MQEQFLNLAEKEAHTWVQATKAGKPFDGAHLVEAAREGMENFIKAQKQFLDVIAEETAKATGGKRAQGTGRKVKKTELAELARQATESFIEAQRKLFDLAGQQMNANVKAAEKSLELLRPFPVPLAQLTREGVKSYVDAQKALMDAMLKHEGGKREMRHPKRPARGHKKEAAAAAVA
jgi:predicted nucleic-acid-binding protein